jgi:hypothetical protein
MKPYLLAPLPEKGNLLNSVGIPKASPTMAPMPQPKSLFCRLLLLGCYCCWQWWWFVVIDTSYEYVKKYFVMRAINIYLMIQLLLVRNIFWTFVQNIFCLDHLKPTNLKKFFLQTMASLALSFSTNNTTSPQLQQ